MEYRSRRSKEIYSETDSIELEAVEALKRDMLSIFHACKDDSKVPVVE